MASTPSPVIGSLLLGSTDATRLRAWYEQVFGVQADVDGFLPLGVGLLVDARDDVAPRSREPGRVVLNVHVSDARAAAERLDEAGAPWVSPLEYRDAGAWFGTVTDPDGNFVQVIELTAEYWRLRGERQRAAGSAPALLAAATPAPRLPVQDLGRARRFYAEKLGLEPVEERPGGLRYRCGGAVFSLFLSSAAAPRGSTRRWAGRSTTSTPWWPSCAGVASGSRTSTSPGCARWTGSPRSRATTPPTAASGSARPGSATVRGT